MAKPVYVALDCLPSPKRSFSFAQAGRVALLLAMTAQGMVYDRIQSHPDLFYGNSLRADLLQNLLRLAALNACNIILIF